MASQMRNIKWSSMLLFIFFLSVVSSYAQPLRLLSAYPRNMAFVEGCLDEFENNLARETNGEFDLHFFGPDVIPTVEQLQPLQSGVFDMLFTIGAYHIGTTGIGIAIDTTKPDPQKRRNTGIFNFIDNHYRGLGIKVISIMPVTDVHFLTRAPIDQNKPSFNGLKIRTAPTVVSLVQVLGGAPVNLSPGDVYLSLQKGVIDGTVMISYGAFNYKWHEVARYMVRPSIGYLSTYLFMNEKRYNRLSEAQRKAFDEAGRLAEIGAADYFKEKRVEEYDRLKALGLKETQMQPEDGKRADGIYNKTIWDLSITKSGEVAKKLRRLVATQGMEK